MTRPTPRVQPRALRVLLCSTALCSALLPDSARALQDTTRDRTRDSLTTLRPMRVTGRLDDLIGVASSAAQGRVGRADLRQRPQLREGELLEVVPGMILTQHSGDGKANQMFVRGFNLDHGTDFQTRIESMPLNLPTHAHGQGYTDLNLLIPELVDHVTYSLGPYYAELGDFGSAGGATLNLVRALPQSIAQVEGGAWGFRRAVAAGSRTAGAHTMLLGGEAKGYDGPWDVAQGLSKRSGVARYTWQGADQSVSLLGLGYHNRWNASDQIPERLVDSGQLPRFGQVDPSLGGSTSRYSLSLDATRLRGRTRSQFEAYAVRYDFELFSNFTYFLDDEANGDQIRQRDGRTIFGFNVEQQRVYTPGSTTHQWRYGAQSRWDNADVSLARTTSRAFHDMVRADVVKQGSIGAWSAIETRWLPQWRSTLGARLDGYRFDVNSDLPVNSGSRTAMLASPKASLAYAPSSRVELYLGGGLGFHSNDARGTTIRIDPASGDSVDAVDPLVRSRGGELGLRMSGARDLRTTISLWTLRLDSELLFVGDAGTTEPQGRSARTGITIANFWRPLRTLAVDGDVSFTRARYVDEPAGEQSVPGALEAVIAAGVQWSPMPNGPAAVVRVRHFGAHPLIEDNTVRGRSTTLLNASIGVPLRSVRLTASVLNLLGSRGRDVQYFYASRLRGEPAGGLDDVHFHPVEPRQVRVGVSLGNWRGMSTPE
ncbi:MAG: TonB-dependent receptor plug domain-containing protein [Gemmatimonadaceae bacterium]|nr:TonB-dependent receptor plug domain-containing protein [Gemmatimonadaceae bacterium]